MFLYSGRAGFDGGYMLDSVPQRTFEQFADGPALQVVEKLVFKVFSQLHTGKDGRMEMASD